MEIDIQVDQVRSLLADASREFDELEAARNTLEFQIEALVEALGKCAEVSAAVTRAGTEILWRDQSAIMVRCNNAVMGVGQAVTEYQRGDEEMAMNVMNAQRAASSPPIKSLQDSNGYYLRAEE
ncbi:DUF6507 family protein [Arthrobacter sp. zg-Y895]|uniref:DUF6507 family protein n=1 Tax=Arthrobacter sp. zg-Y895 TaxID=2886933 RepID=UPI001D14FEC3|nr:DUF6507 family protein [Arthrobacter sp. zg-Y895]MCC3302115.1 DUF6507 family protein [Arthrobacter sp. zg-Y895]